MRPELFPASWGGISPPPPESQIPPPPEKHTKYKKHFKMHRIYLSYMCFPLESRISTDCGGQTRHWSYEIRPYIYPWFFVFMLPMAYSKGPLGHAPFGKKNKFLTKDKIGKYGLPSIYLFKTFFQHSNVDTN